ncbi:MAG: DUF4012 domain-containing protein [Patescibacteria group bacterium]
MKLVHYLKEFPTSHKKLSLFIGIASLSILLFNYYLVQPTLFLYGKSKTLQRDLRPVLSALKRRDIETLNFELKYFRPQVEAIKKASVKIGVFASLPLAGPYARDLKNTGEAALEGYDTVIQMASFMVPLLPGVTFEGWQKNSLTNSQTLKAGDVAKILPSVSTELGKYKTNLESISRKLMTLDEARYPEYFRGRPVRKYIAQLRTGSSLINKYFDDLIGTLALVPELIGTTGPKNYLIIIQNDKEIRPSGGLLGGYAFLSMDNGSFRLVKSGDISFLDKEVRSDRLPAPEFISRFLGEKSLYMKDANYSPDFKKSASTLLELWSNTPQPVALEGIIVLDTQFLKTLIDTLGEIKLDNGELINSGNIEATFDSFFLFIGDQSAESRKYKDITSVILNELLKKSFSYSTYNASGLLQKVLSLGAAKHILIYSPNEGLQKLVEKYGLSGALKDYAGDYLLINDAIFSPQRSNWRVSQEVEKTVKIEADQLVNELGIEFMAKPEPGSPPDVGNLHFVRVYVPKGSKLIGAEGTTEPVITGEDFNKTVFTALVKLEPNQNKMFTLKYTSPKPQTPEGTYRLLIQKQPGTYDFKYTLKIEGKTEDVILSEDKTIEIETR